MAPSRRQSAAISALGAWTALLLFVAARAYRAILLTLLAIALVPYVFSWRSYVVMTGSMRPAITAGDVVVTSPLGSTTALKLGRVMVFTSPATDRTTVHRVVATNAPGLYETKGDANPQQDPEPVARKLFSGQPRLLVPYIGRPVLWVRHHRYGLLVSWSVLTMTAFAFASRRPRRRAPPQAPPPAPAPTRPPDTERRGPRSRTHAAPRRARSVLFATLTLVVLGWIVGTGSASGVAKFTAETRMAGNTWQTAARLLQQYTAQVLADNPYAFYLTDDATGPLALDSSGNARTGTYGNISAYLQPGANPRDPGYSVKLNGNSARLVVGGLALTNPTTYTLELWFKTSSVTGGKLFGFESTQLVTSPLYDRILVMGTDGRISYGGWTKTQPHVITSPLAYNNGAWHHLALVCVPQGANQTSTLYVDGAAVASGTTSQTSSFSGWWQVGFGDFPNTGTYPANANFIGNIDNVAVYQTALSATRIAAHYAA